MSKNTHIPFAKLAGMDEEDMAINYMRRRADLCIKISMKELHAATKGFSSKQLLEKGELAATYRGILLDGRSVVVKLFASSSKDHFLTELHVLGQIFHHNVIRVLGFSSEEEHMALVFPMMCGSLKEHLSGNKNCALNWDRRMKIAVGVAQSLVYLHHDRIEQIVHCDLKPSSILLDEEFEPHLAGFERARILGAQQDPIPPLSEEIFGYTAPEITSRSEVSTKADVFSFGILLLHLVTGESPTNSKFQNGSSITRWVRQALRTFTIEDIVDSRIVTNSPALLQEIGLVAKLGIFCAQRSPMSRPNMKAAIAMLLDCRHDSKLQDWQAISMQVLADEKSGSRICARRPSPT